MKSRREPFAEFKNIRVLPSGYQVTITRGKNEFSRHFAGLTPESHRAATKFRDKVLRDLPSKRLHSVPSKILKANGLTSAVVGVSRNPARSFYQVSFRAKGKLGSKSFSWKKRSEAEAYAEAIAFRKTMFKRRS